MGIGWGFSNAAVGRSIGLLLCPTRLNSLWVNVLGFVIAFMRWRLVFAAYGKPLAFPWAIFATPEEEFRIDWNCFDGHGPLLFVKQLTILCLKIRLKSAPIRTT
jgi:hypothetical protein